MRHDAWRYLALAVLAATMLAACGGGTPGGTSAGASGPPDAAPPAPSETLYEIETDALVLSPGGEASKCFYAPFPADHDVAIVRAELFPSTGSHHFAFEYLPPGAAHPDTAGYASCDGAPGVFIGGAQREPVDERMPEDTAVFVPQGSWLHVLVHYVDAGTEPETVFAKAVLHAVDPALVKRWANATLGAIEDSSIEVPPYGSQSVTARCLVDTDTTVFGLWSHMHSHGKRFTMAVYDPAGGVTPIYQSSDWENPKFLDASAAPIKIAAGQSLQWTCDYDNPGSTDVVGGGDATNEMCNLAAFHFGDQPEPTKFCVEPSIGP